jgi:hypothetical protein
LSLPELLDGHAGVKVADKVMVTLQLYGITNKLGYITADNHGANDTMCEALARQLPQTDWQPEEQRLRCVGHIINIAIQAFFFAKDSEALELAVTESQRSGVSIDDELCNLSEKDDTGGWLRTPPLQKIISFCTSLRRSDRLYGGFRGIAGKVIRAPCDTRWNSYLFTLEDALHCKTAYTTFACENLALEQYQLTASEWQLVEETVAFLQPFKEATKRCEGDDVTLDKVQVMMDWLAQHLKEQKVLHKANTSFLASIVTAWYAFDKYYQLIDSTGAYSAAILLHPNYRKSYLQSAWRKDWVAPGIDRARAIWQRYKQETTDSASNDTTAMTQYERFLYDIQQRQRGSKGAQDEFDRFINAPAESITIPALDWWLEPSQKRSYPQLSRMAIDTLSAMAMSAESERVFSGTRRTIPWTRARLESTTIEHLECLKHWQKGGVISDSFILSSSDSDSEQHLEDPAERQHPS